ncbi:hypothetical protein HPB50_002187 [Hyalomma asiaticum]|uniref:Uncharacterized protein n=1 Tax=Hyalomma asiaticum TaxID=266040 RepID=A0ACB7RH94_HYAAI|nr:hypothetical protein HPB50_002187 [Hyalomma asiaticum]
MRPGEMGEEMGTEEPLEAPAIRQTSAVSTTEEEASPTVPKYVANKPKARQAQDKTAALDAEPVTRLTSKRPKKVRTKHTRPASTTRPSLRGALVCTVGTKVNRSLALPADGLCDFTFFDSLQRNGVNELSGPFEENFRYFTEHAARHTITEYGAGFDYQ